MLLFIFLFFISIMSVSAYVTAGNDCENKRNCMVVCNYTNVVENDDYTKHVTIYYNFDSNNFMTSYWDGRLIQGSPVIITKTSDDFQKLFYSKYNQTAPNVNLSKSNFKCPKHGYYDMYKFLAGGNEACFDNDGKWCLENGNNSGTRFEGYKSEKRDMSYEEEIDYWFKNTALNEVTLETVMSGKYASANDIWEKIILEDFKKNYLANHDLPEFIANSTAYKNGYKNVAKKFEELQKQWKKELDEKKDSGTITEEQYNETIKKVDNINKNIEEVGKDYSENFNVIRSLDKLPVTDINICQQNSNSLKVFQVIGYFILIAKIIAPIILIILGSITFAKAALSNDEKATMDAAVMFGKKVLIGLIIFFVPTVLDFGLSLVSGVSDTMQKFENCTACIFSPNDSGRCSPQNLQDGSDDSTNDDNGGSNSNTNNSDSNGNNGNNSNNDKNSTGNTYGYDCYYEYKNSKGITSVGYNKNGSVTLIQHDGKKINESVSSGQNKGNSKYETDECYPLITVTLKELPQHGGYKVSYKIGKTQDDVSMGKTNRPRTAKLVTN